MRTPYHVARSRQKCRSLSVVSTGLRCFELQASRHDEIHYLRGPERQRHRTSVPMRRQAHSRRPCCFYAASATRAEVSLFCQFGWIAEIVPRKQETLELNPFSVDNVRQNVVECGHPCPALPYDVRRSLAFCFPLRFYFCRCPQCCHQARSSFLMIIGSPPRLTAQRHI